MATRIEVPLVDKQGKQWEVSVRIWGDYYRKHKEGMQIVEVTTPTGALCRSEFEGDVIWANGDGDQAVLKTYIDHSVFLD